MFLYLLSVIVLVFLNGGHALVTQRSARERSDAARALGVRQYLESLASDATMAPDVAMLPVSLSEDGQSYYILTSTGNMTFRVALDTGSADFWLVSSQCTTSACTNVPKYQLAYESSTFVTVNGNNSAFNVSYADTTAASGFIAKETVHMGNLTVSNQAFGLVANSNVTLTDEISGVLGLGFPRLSTIYDEVVNATPILSTMAQLGQLDYPVFGLSLTDGAWGTLAIGAIDGSIVQNRSMIQWNEVVPFAPLNNSTDNATSYLQWAIVLSSFSVGNVSFDPMPTYPSATSNSSLALLDIGTAAIFGPIQDVSRLYEQLPGSRLMNEIGQWSLPCTTLTVISFKFGGHDYFLQPTDYLMAPIEEDTALCMSLIMSAPPNSGAIDWQFGTPMMRTVYSIFSLGIDTKEAPLIGLYPLSNATSLTESAANISSFLSSQSVTIATEIPSSLLTTPSYTIPAYVFNTSYPAPAGLIVSSELAASTYVPALGSVSPNLSAIPTITPLPTLVTLIVTNDGSVSTSISTATPPTVPLGEPPGWSNGVQNLHAPFHIALPSIFTLIIVCFLG